MSSKESSYNEMSYLKKRKKDKRFGRLCKTVMKQKKSSDNSWLSKINMLVSDKCMKVLYSIFTMCFFMSSNPALADKAIFAGGCFWCMESDFEKIEGVSEVISGFTGGTTENPTYNGNHEGHYEAVEVIYDPNNVSYKKLLEYFWVNIDPFDDKGQFCDKGPSYLSAIFVSNAEERKLAEESKQRVVKMFPNKKVVTPILNASTFYPIAGNESYHQDFYKNSAIRYKFYRWNCGRDQRLKEIWGPKPKL